MRERALSAAKWSAVDLLGRQGVHFAVIVILARMLSPSEFGTVALLYLFVGVGGAFAESGLTAALIQRQVATADDEHTVFWLNIGIGTLMGLLLSLAGPALAALYDEPVLAPLSMIMALTIPLGALGAVPRARFTKALEFKPLMWAGVLSTLGSGLASIAMAWAGYGVWALAAQAVLAAAVHSIVVLQSGDWRPKFVFRIDSARSLFGFGGYMLASALLETAHSRFYALLIGKFYGIQELGYYNRADTTAQFPSAILSGIISRVAFPLFSRIAHTPDRLARALKTTLQGVNLINAPAMLGLSAISNTLVEALFGKAWLPAAPILQVLSLAGIFMPFHVLNLQALMGAGRSELFFRLEVIKKLVGMTLIMSTSGLGPMGVAWGMFASSLLAYFINAYYSGKLFGYGAVHQFRDAAPTWLAAIVMAAAIASLERWLCEVSASLLLIILPGSGALLYVLLVLLVRPAALTSMIELMQGTRNPLARWRK